MYNEIFYKNLDYFGVKILLGIILYMVFVSILSLIAYNIFKPTSRFRISNKEINSKQIKVEMLYTIRTVFIQGLMHAILFTLFLGGIYFNGETSLTYDFLTFIGLILFHDTYFYWTHRLLHKKMFFRFIHKVHHDARSPTTFSAYRYTAIEAVFQFAFFYIFIFFIPISVEVATCFIVFSSYVNILGHSNIELLPKWWLKLKFFSTPTFHSMHHEKVTSNYGLYFTFWDKLMKTSHRDYEERFLSKSALIKDD
jgi:lathosterol oxidase